MSLRVDASPATGLFLRATVRETAILLALAWLVPFLVHLVPWSGERPAGAYLLPMFWTAFMAVYLYGLRVGLLVGLFAPALNLLLTGLPALARLGTMAFELTIFAVCAWWAVRRAGRAFWLAPAAYVVAKLVTSTWQAATGVSAAAVWSALPASLGAALPGLAILALINFILIRQYPKQGGVRGHDAAGV